MDAVRNFPKQERDLLPLLSLMDVFNNNINCLQKTYSFLTSKQLLVSAFQHGHKTSLNDFTGPSKRLSIRTQFVKGLILTDGNHLGFAGG